MSEVCKHKLVLGSASPRRKQLLEGAGFRFRVMTADVDESRHPEDIDAEALPEYLSGIKADALVGKIDEDEIVITADTVVCINGKVLGKPADHSEAFSMLSELSGCRHRVITGVTIASKDKRESFSVSTDVFFRELAVEEIEYYIDTCRPFDKAGAYGIQEWIGFIGIERIEGSFYNVMGMPIQTLFTKLKNW